MSIPVEGESIDFWGMVFVARMLPDELTHVVVGGVEVVVKISLPDEDGTVPIWKCADIKEIKKANDWTIVPEQMHALYNISE